VSTAFSFLKVLLGTGRFGVLEARWEKMEGAAVAGHHCCVASPLFLFLFFDMFFAVVLAFSYVQTVVSMWLLYYYSGAKACFEELGCTAELLGMEHEKR
jgi:hypothetical protein